MSNLSNFVHRQY